MAEVKHMTAAQFRRLPESTTPMELIENEVVMTPLYPHPEVVFELAIVVRSVIPKDVDW